MRSMPLKVLLLAGANKRRCPPCHAEPHGEALGWSGGRRGEGRVWPRAFIVVSLGRNDQGRVGKFEQV